MAKKLFPKGVSANPNGRGKGVQNKKTILLETFCQDIIEGGVERFNNAMNTLADKSPDKYVTAYLQLLEYVKPKLARQEVNLNSKGELFVKFEEIKTYDVPNEYTEFEDLSKGNSDSGTAE